MVLQFRYFFFPGIKEKKCYSLIVPPRRKYHSTTEEKSFHHGGTIFSTRWNDLIVAYKYTNRKEEKQENIPFFYSLFCEQKKNPYICIIIPNKMIVTFEEKYLRDLYEKGTTNDKKHRYQPDIIKRYRKCINTLLAVKAVQDLLFINSLNYEILKGDKQGISSIRVNDKYRIEFIIKETVEEPIVTICNIIDLSNHYK